MASLAGEGRAADRLSRVVGPPQLVQIEVEVRGEVEAHGVALDEEVSVTVGFLEARSQARQRAAQGGTACLLVALRPEESDKLVAAVSLPFDKQEDEGRKGLTRRKDDRPCSL